MRTSPRVAALGKRWRTVDLSDSRVRVLTLTSLVAALGVGVFSTVALLYLTGPLRLPVGEVGLALTVSGLIGQAASVPAGRLADRGHCGAVLAGSLAVRAATTLAVAFLTRSALEFAFYSCVNAAAYQAWTAARGAAVAEVADRAGATGLAAHLRMVGNLGISLGVPVAGVALVFASPLAYRCALCATAASFLLAAARVLGLRLAPRTELASKTSAGRVRPWRDARFLAATLLSAVTSMQYVLLDYALPLWIAGHTGAPRWMVAATGLINTIVVVALQVPASRGTQDLARAARVTALSGLAVAAACATLALADGPGPLLACALLALGTVLLSLGEVWQTAGGNGLSYGLAPHHATGEYQGFYGIGQGVALAAGPSVMSCTVLRLGTAGWLAVGAALALCALAAPVIVARRPAREAPAAAKQFVPEPSWQMGAIPMSVPEIVLLTRRPLERYPVWEWVEANVRVVAPIEHKASAARAPVEVSLVERYADSAELDLAVLELAGRSGFDHLIAMSEYDVLRAARLRTVLDLPGQREVSAAAFRDKAVMKSHWRAAHVPAARFSPLHAAADLIAFGRREGWPVVVKPRRGSGSVGVAVLSNEAVARRWLRTHWRVRYDELSPWMAESFVDGRMLQVDGVYADGRCQVNWPTRVSSLLAWAQGGSTFSVALEPGDPAVPAIRELVRAALRALPEPAGPIVYHAEVWQPASGGLLMNEIAARIGGGLTRPLIQAGFGVDLVRRFVEATVRPGPARAAAPDFPHTVAGEIAVPPRVGVVGAVEDLSTRLSAPWIHTASVKPQIGRYYTGASDSVDTIAEAVVTGVSAQQVGDRLATVAGWFDSAIRYREHDCAPLALRPIPSQPRASAGAL